MKGNDIVHPLLKNKDTCNDKVPSSNLGGGALRQVYPEVIEVLSAIQQILASFFTYPQTKIELLDIISLL